MDENYRKKNYESHLESSGWHYVHDSLSNDMLFHLLLPARPNGISYAPCRTWEQK